MWTPLLSKAHWLAYVESKIAEFGLRHEVVEWGAGPSEYPCLAASTLLNDAVSGRRVVSCFVYVQNGLDLVGLADSCVPVTQQGVPVTRQAPGRRAETRPTLPERVREFMRYSAANSLTQAHFMFATGICTQPQYEGKFAEFLAMVDQDEAARREAMAEQEAGVAGIFDRLAPPRE